jgi:hypothetical protein
LSPTVDPTAASSSYPSTAFGKKSQPNDKSNSKVILASVLGAIGGLIVVGLVAGGAVYVVSAISRGGSTAVPNNDIPLPELHSLVPADSEVV